MNKIEDAVKTQMKNIELQTGQSFDFWVKVARDSELTKAKQIIDLLKTKHGFTYGNANLVALTALKVGMVSGKSGDELITDQFAGDKTALKPIYDKVIATIQTFGSDVELAPKKTYVSLRRNKQFGCIQPSTATRLDVGLNLKDTPPTDRLELSGSWNGMVSHRVRVSSPKEIDKQLIAWLRQAYDAA